MLDRAVATTELMEDLLLAHGPITRRDTEMRAGDRILNDDHELLPRIARATGLGLSLYLANRRIAHCCNVEVGPGRDIGGFADAELVESVLRHQGTFRGRLLHDGRRQLVACRPLFSATSPDKAPVGMIEAYQDEQTYEDAVESELRQVFGAPDQSAVLDRADRMDAVIRFIDDVSRRLQLLALNGNIIAAQAGDHGRAFRVVCRELGSLADQSKGAVAQVRRLVEELLPTMEEANPLDPEVGSELGEGGFWGTPSDT